MNRSPNTPAPSQSRSVPWPPLLGALLPALAFAGFILYIALDHNPQGEFYGGEEGTQWGNIAALFGCAFLGVFIPLSAVIWFIFSLRKILHKKK